MFQRNHLQILQKRISEKRKFIQVIFGPRQVGKTTIINQLIENQEDNCHFVSADGISSNNSTWIEQQWETVRLKLKQSESTEKLLIIDEIQKIENWSEIVKSQWDSDTRNKIQIKVILLGSSRLLLQQGLTESLTGRFETIYMGHWSFSEMESAFGWNAEQFAWFGGYPGSAELIEDEVRWKNYVNHSLVETSISKDILMLTRVDKPALMRRLFELGCSYSGQILSFTKMLGQLQDAGNTTTLSHYLNLLDTAGLLSGLEKYSPEKVRQRGSSPKFQVYNMALISSQKAEKFAEIQTKPELWGRIVESSVGTHLLNYLHQENYKLLYWRDGNSEVDFVLQKGDKMVGIEVKSGLTQKAKGMDAFKKKCNPDKIYLVGNSGLSWQEFLKVNPAELF